MKAAAIIGYLGGTAVYSYLVSGPWDGTGHNPSSWPMLGGLLLLHVAAGVAIGRWWALLLPFAWSAVSVPAQGYDTPVWIIVLFQAPFFWAPAIALGVALRQLAWPRIRAF